LEFIVLILVIGGYFTWLAFPLVLTASESSRLVSVFSWDEMQHLDVIRDALDAGSPRLNWSAYGHLSFNLVLLPLQLLSYSSQISDQHIIVALRLESAIFAVGTVAATFILARRFFGSFAAWLSALALPFGSLEFQRWSVVAHPDILQVFFFVLGIYFCCRLAEQGHFRWLLLASVAAGLAFASKYGGVFLLPVIWTVVAARIMAIGKGGGLVRINAVQFGNIARYCARAFGIIFVIAGIILTPDIVWGYFFFENSTREAWALHLLTSMRVAVIVTGSILVLLSLPRTLWSAIGRMPRLLSFLRQVLVSCVVFGLTFVVASPFSVDRLAFVRGIVSESRHIATGHIFKANLNGLDWFGVMLSPEVVDGMILLLAAVSLGFNLRRGIREGWRWALTPGAVIWIFVILYITFLVSRVNLHEARYLLPIVPLLFILAAQVLSQATMYMAGKMSRRLAPVLVLIAFSVILGLELLRSFSQVSEYRQLIIDREQTNVSIEAGLWLEQQYPANARVLYDYYTWVPPYFANAVPIFGGTLQDLEKLEPDLVVVNKAIAERFSDLRRASAYIGGEGDFKESYEYYQTLAHNSAGYTLLRDFGNVQIYGRTTGDLSPD
jgi:hypothetical protein